MRVFLLMISVSALVLTVSPLPAQDKPAQEQPAKSKIVSVGLFKNGLAIVKREIEVPGPGTYRLDDVPEPVHGTWWIDSPGVETSVEMRESEVADDAAPAGNLQEELAGKLVTVHFRGGKLGEMRGTVLKLNESPTDTARRTERMLILKTRTGRLYVDIAEIAAVDVDWKDRATAKKPVLILRVAKADGKALHVTYLTHGLSWASSYRVDISDPKSLKLELGGVIRNELADLKDAQMRLISGFPSVQFGHVKSLLAPKASWAAFFQELRSGGRGFDQALLLQNTTSNDRGYVNVMALNLSANPMGEGVDLHYQSIGKRTLAKGDALALTLAEGKATYERIVEWIIPDNRDEHGRYHARARSEDEPEDPWDALRFKNPFDFPMTTGPALVTAKGQFNGQRTCYWVNAGEETCVRITKALSIRTRNVEQEVLAKGNGEADIIYVGGNRYRRSTIAAEIAVSNHRSENVKMLIRRRFSGELKSADGDPKTFLREEGAYSVNKRNELTWTITLRPGEEQKLQYRYNVLVAH
ncbi:MAG: DUF4139 domain-containing protein [Planctomycetes bacterium]|nr:DUF4139 domain-containing protein [Planctomycetota bacterium]